MAHVTDHNWLGLYQLYVNSVNVNSGSCSGHPELTFITKGTDRIFSNVFLHFQKYCLKIANDFYVTDLENYVFRSITFPVSVFTPVSLVLVSQQSAWKWCFPHLWYLWPFKLFVLYHFFSASAVATMRYWNLLTAIWWQKLYYLQF